MRYVTLRFDDQAEFVQAMRRTDRPRSIEWGPIHHLDLLEDGSMVHLQSVGGDLAAYADALTASEAVHAGSVAGEAAGYAYVHYDPTDVARAFVRWQRRFPVVVRTPIELDGDDPLVTLVGTVEGVSGATAALPDPLTCAVADTGSFDPATPALFHGLTDRQREILTTAIDLGYYENPREATQADVGAAVSLAPGTVGTTSGPSRPTSSPGGRGCPAGGSRGPESSGLVGRHHGSTQFATVSDGRRTCPPPGRTGAGSVR